MARRIGLALAVAAQFYVVADALSGGRLHSRVELALRQLERNVRARFELEQAVARGTGPVIWEAMEALDDGDD